MTSVGELVKQHWLRQGIKLRRGASEGELAAFESKYNVCLPEDMRECFSVVNGFENSGGWDVDNEMITFFSLEEIESLSASDAISYFVFADWSISAHVYAIRLSKDCAALTPVVVTHDKLVKVANSFGEFMKGYAEGSEAMLFPPPKV